jgi:hypothetical protein
MGVKKQKEEQQRGATDGTPPEQAQEQPPGAPLFAQVHAGDRFAVVFAVFDHLQSG